MRDKGDGELPSALVSQRSASPAVVHRTIEDLAREAREDRKQLEDFSARPLISSRELRRLWEVRVRPFWRLNLGAYQALTRRLIELGENYLAIETAAEGMEFFGDDPKLILASALASARCGAIDHTGRILLEKERALRGTSEYLSLLGRTHKDIWKISADTRELEESFRCYREDYLLEKERTPERAAFPGANAASMALLLGKHETARQLAREVLAILEQRPTSDYWHEVTRAECELVLGDVEGAWQHYLAATNGSPQPCANLMTTRAQVRLLLPMLGRDARSFDSCFAIPRVACFSGHRLDAADRSQARFPAASAEAVKARIDEAVKKLNIGFGFSSAANGADILFLEVMQALGRETYVNLPLSEPEFIQSSVAHASSPEWAKRFEKVIERATAVTTSDAGLPPSGIVFEYSNRLSFGAASQKARELDTELLLLAVWDGHAASDRGGTADVIQMAGAAGKRIEIITPAGEPLPFGFNLTSPREYLTTDEAILHGLALTVGEGDAATADEKIASVLRGRSVVATEVHGRSFHLFFQRCEDAADAALDLLAAIAPQLNHSLGLHALPVRKRIQPVNGAVTFSPRLIETAAELSALEPAGHIYTSMGFAAFAEETGRAEFHCEFLGHRRLKPGAKSEAVFRLVAS